MSTYDFKINDITLSLSKVFKELKNFVAKDFKWNH